jgi:protein-histidine N-methyltransferase
MCLLPSKIAWGVIEIESPGGKRLLLPRRELFDIRVQLMSEEDVLESNNPTGLDDADIKTNVYEGGYKTWECSYDLAKLLLDRGPREQLDNISSVDHVVEVFIAFTNAR